MFYLNEFSDSHPEIGSYLEQLMDKRCNGIKYYFPYAELARKLRTHFCTTLSFHDSKKEIVVQLKSLSSDYIKPTGEISGLIDSSLFRTPTNNVDHIWVAHTNNKIPPSLLLIQMGEYIDRWVSFFYSMSNKAESKGIIFDSESKKSFNLNNRSMTAIDNCNYNYNPGEISTIMSLNVNAMSLAIYLNAPKNNVLINIAQQAVNDNNALLLLKNWSESLSAEFQDKTWLNRFAKSKHFLKKIGKNEKYQLHNICVISEMAYWLLTQKKY